MSLKTYSYLAFIYFALRAVQIYVFKSSLLGSILDVVVILLAVLGIVLFIMDKRQKR
jgi:hypothetical protein